MIETRKEPDICALLIVAASPDCTRLTIKPVAICTPAITACVPSMMRAGAKKVRIRPPTISIGGFQALKQLITDWAAGPTVCRALLNQQITALHVVCSHEEI